MKRVKVIGKVLLSVFLLLGLITFLVFQLPSFGGTFSGERLQRMQKSPEYQGERFEDNPKQNTDSSLIKNFQLYQQGIVREPQIQIPVVKIDPASLKVQPAPGLRSSWFGHASVLSEIDGVRMMTDPVLSERVSPLTFVGPKRFHPPPISLGELSGIDFVVISHDHYDHLDMETVKHLGQQGTHFFVGLGVGAHLERWGVSKEQIHEMDWWDEATFKGLKIVCTPARHYSGRKSMNNSTLWTSWIVKGPEHSIYFSGDTGYAGHFTEIRKKYGPVDMTFMKVGAYGDTWLDIHMNPESAVQAHLDLEAKVMLPVHWATFDLSYHAWDEPILRTLKAAKEKNVEVITPRIGEFYEFGKPFVNVKWYQRP
jgi:L-ascorbate metabolism protein UlaG (beta-lactamase superfamily)